MLELKKVIISVQGERKTFEIGTDKVIAIQEGDEKNKYVNQIEFENGNVEKWRGPVIMMLFCPIETEEIS